MNGKRARAIRLLARQMDVDVKSLKRTLKQSHAKPCFRIKGQRYARNGGRQLDIHPRV